MVFCSLIASSAIRAFISALKFRRCLDFISARFPRQRFYTLMSGPNFGEHFTERASTAPIASCGRGIVWQDGMGKSIIGKARLKSASQVVEDAAGAGEIGETFFFGAEFGGMGDETAAGAARGVFDVEHFVVEDVFDRDLRDARMIHAAI